MRMDCRVKHDVEVRRKAAELFASGMGSCTVASTLSVPLSTVKNMAPYIPRVWKRGATDHGWQAGPLHL